MAKKKEGGFDPPWLLVAAAFALPLPIIGFWLLWLKARHPNRNSDKDQKKSSPRKMNTSAFTMIGFGLFITLVLELSSFGWSLVLGGASFAVYNAFTIRRKKRLERLAAIIGSRPCMPIQDIADAAGISYKSAVRDLQDMLDADELVPSTAYLDLGQGLYVRSSSDAPPKPAPAPTPKPREESSPAEASSEESEYQDIIRRIRSLNASIKNHQVASHVAQIQQTATNIFHIISRYPEKKASVHTFMNYYLPTTLKLLDIYSTMEKQGFAGPNIESSKKNIEQLLGQLVWAFQSQNDRLFQDDALDISSDIKVMEAMLARDGLAQSASSSPFRQTET